MMASKPGKRLIGLTIGLLIYGVSVISSVSVADDVAIESGATPRKVMQIKQALVQAMRSEALAADEDARHQAIRQIVALLQEVTRHPDTLSGPFRRMAMRARIRLRRIQHELRPETIEGTPPTALAQQLNPGTGPAVLSADNGADLIDLIEQTISQDVWVGQGGSASMVYYAPVHGLVVTAPAFVHDQIADLLWQLRAAGP
ncbi:MAG: hypothetical protein AAGF97_13145 [Planctomycetota bacterium]